MKTLKIFLAALLSLLCAAFSYASDLVDYTDPTQVVKAFCQSEFEGVQDRLGQNQRDLLVKFSKQREVQHWKKYGTGPSTVEITIDKLILVSRYEIGNVSVHGNNGVATVVYQQLARTEGVGNDRTFIKDVRPNQQERLKLLFDENRWWIYNPGLPRVSSEVMTRTSKEILQGSLDPEKRSGFPPLDLTDAKKLKKNIEVLESLDK